LAWKEKKNKEDYIEASKEKFNSGEWKRLHRTPPSKRLREPCGKPRGVEPSQTKRVYFSEEKRKRSGSGEEGMGLHKTLKKRKKYQGANQGEEQVSIRKEGGPPVKRAAGQRGEKECW